MENHDKVGIKKITIAYNENSYWYQSFYEKIIKIEHKKITYIENRSDYLTKKRTIKKVYEYDISYEDYKFMKEFSEIMDYLTYDLENKLDNVGALDYESFLTYNIELTDGKHIKCKNNANYNCERNEFEKLLKPVYKILDKIISENNKR